MEIPMKKEAWRLEKEQMVKDFHVRNRDAVKGQTVFVGSSLMEMFPVEEWAREADPDAPIVYNRGVGGYRTTDLLPILDACVFELSPHKVFINIGTNDLSDASIPLTEVMQHYDLIITRIEEQLPGVIIYMMAYYPVNSEAASEEMKPCLSIRTNEKITRANELVKELAGKHGQRYINVNAPLTDEKGRLKAEYTIEGMHINQKGYRAIWEDILLHIKEA